MNDHFKNATLYDKKEECFLINEKPIIELKNQPPTKFLVLHFEEYDLTIRVSEELFDCSTPSATEEETQ